MVSFECEFSNEESLVLEKLNYKLLPQMQRSWYNEERIRITWNQS